MITYGCSSHTSELLLPLAFFALAALSASDDWDCAALKKSTALSQATMAGGATAGVLYSLFHSNPTKPGLPVVSFRLAVELGPLLILGTSLGEGLFTFVTVMLARLPAGRLLGGCSWCVCTYVCWHLKSLNASATCSGYAVA